MKWMNDWKIMNEIEWYANKHFFIKMKIIKNAHRSSSYIWPSYKWIKWTKWMKINGEDTEKPRGIKWLEVVGPSLTGGWTQRMIR